MNKKCNKICVNCTHYCEENTHRCSIVIDQVNDCVTGGESNIFLSPEAGNCKGDCKYYEEDTQRVLWNKIRNLLERYDREVFMQYCGDYTRWSEYWAMDNLRDVLSKKRIWKSDEDRDEDDSPTEKKKHWWD